MKKAITILLLFTMYLAEANPLPNNRNKPSSPYLIEYHFKSLDDSLILPKSAYSSQIKYKNFFNINILPILFESTTSAFGNGQLFTPPDSHFQFIQYQLGYERKISPKSSLELIFTKKNPINTSPQEYITLSAQNSYDEMFAMKFSESYMACLSFKTLLMDDFYISAGPIYRYSWFKNQKVRWGLSEHHGIVYHDKADIDKRDIGLRLTAGYKFYLHFGDKAICVDAFTGLELLKSYISIYHYDFYKTEGRGGSPTTIKQGSENLNTLNISPQIGLKIGFCW